MAVVVCLSGFGVECQKQTMPQSMLEAATLKEKATPVKDKQLLTFCKMPFSAFIDYACNRLMHNFSRPHHRLRKTPAVRRNTKAEGLLL